MADDHLVFVDLIFCVVLGLRMERLSNGTVRLFLICSSTIIPYFNVLPYFGIGCCIISKR